VRSQVISLRERPFVEAAKAVGASKTHIMVRHILPNVMSLVYVTLATTVPGNIVSEASLGFLGFTDPSRMSWGLMLNNLSMNDAYGCWWWVIPPGLCIAAIAVAFIMFGFALDEILNPRLRLRR
jgi:peptide/nickel transport system permease protein